MTIICLNIWGGRLTPKLLDFFKKYSDTTDVFCLQEVLDDGRTTREIYNKGANMNIFADIQAVLPTFQKFFHASEDHEEGMAIFVRDTITVRESGDMFAFRWKNAMENNDSKTLGRNMQYVSLVQNDERYFIGNFHGLWNGQGKTDSKDRLSQSQKIQSFLTARPEKYKVLLGDFNLLPDTESIRILEKGMVNLVRAYGVQSTRTSLYTGESKHANYVFVSPHLKVQEFKILSDEVSDHTPLYLKVK